MDKEVVEHDFEYYRRTIEKTYKDYYQKVLVFFGIVLVVQSIVFFMGNSTFIDVFFVVVMLSGLLFFMRKAQKYENFIEEEKSVATLSNFLEDGNYYYIPEENLKFAKKNSRNLISQKRGITFFIGIQPFNPLKPIYIRYYDMLEMPYTEKFKLDKNNVSYTKTRWKYRMSSWLAMAPALLFLIYILFFRVSFIGSLIMEFFSSLFR